MTERSTDAPETSAIAVVGMAGRFPGARNVEELWQNVSRGVESIRRLTPEEMRAAGVDPASFSDPRWVPAGGVLDGADLFDAAFFQITPREAELLDPQHRIFLECAWEALEDAGCDPSRFPGAIGAFAGSGLNTYLLHNLLPGGESVVNPQVAIANDKDFLTTRLSYKLDLKGPSLDVQTGCSTSLVSIVLACQSLLNFQCDLALAGGVAVREPQRAGYLYQENGILSPDGHCRPFDAQAAGTVPGNGVGVVVLKRLEDALADGDTIRAVILGAALNNDGAAKVGFTAPGVAGQAEVVATALAVAGVRPEHISYVEAHGTATPLGDPIEVRALDRVFRTEGSRPGFCGLGSLKSNLGHLDAAAGVAGLIKTVLALEHRQIPPTLHFAQPHPDAGLEGSPFYVPAELRPWEAEALPRRAGVSSFGIGGTNAHVVLEEAPPWEITEAPERPELLILSARTPAALDAATNRLADHLESHPELALRDVVQTLRLGRKPMEARRAVVVRDRVDAAAALRDPERLLTAQVPQGDVRVAFLFPGQGAQHAGMAAGLYETEPAFRKAFDACGPLPLGAKEGNPLPNLDATEITQPALFAVEYALAKLWQSWGVQPAAFLGHSLGEYVAACLAGVFSLEAAMRLVTLRGRLMQSLPPGAMLSVSLAEQDLRPLLDEETEIGAVNAPDRCVATGTPEAIERLRERLAARGIEARPLPVERAFHSRHVEPVLAEFMEEVRRARPAAPQIPYISNLTGTWVTAEQATDPAYWGEHLRRAVRFSNGIETLRSEPGWVLLEVGPGQTLASLVRRNGGSAIASLPSRDDATPPRESLLAALGRLWLAGAPIEWKGRKGARRVPLPTYPFERQRFWIEPKRLASPPTAGPRLRTPLWKQALPASSRRLVADGAAWLVFSDAGGLGAQLLSRLQADRLEPMAVTPGPGFSRITASAYSVDPTSAADYDALLDAVLAGGRPLRIVHLADEKSLTPLAEALLRRAGVPPIRLDVIVTGRLDPTGSSLAASAALLGTCRGLAAAGIACRLVDLVPLPPGAPLEGREMKRLLDQIHAEIAAPAGLETAVAWRSRHRWIEVWEELPAVPAATDRPRDSSWRIAGDSEAHELARLLASRPGTKVSVEGAEESRWNELEASMHEIAGRVTAEIPAGGAGLIAAATEALCTSYVVAALRARGVEPERGDSLSIGEIQRRISLATGQKRLFYALLRMLRDDDLVEIRGEEVRFLRSFHELPRTTELRQAREAEAPQLRGLFDLLDHCGRHLAQVLAAEIPGLSVLYPDGSSEALARAVQAAESEGPRDVAPLLLRELLQRAERPLRILEVGAGQGTLTREVLPVLPAGSEYWFTDVGRSFVLAAEGKYKDNKESFASRMRFAVFDITRDPAGQGIPLGSFNAVLGANVVHATPRIAETLGHLRPLLAPGGLLALMETVRRQRWADLVWGLTDGWWSFADAPLRTESPLLDPRSWEEVLGRSGFEGAMALPREEQDLETALILARNVMGDSQNAARNVVYLTRDPAALPLLAARAEEQTEGIAVALLADEGAEAEDLVTALDRAVESGLLQVAVARGAVSEKAAAPVEDSPEPPPPAALHGRPQLMTAFVEPRTDDERAIAALWQRALGIERIGVHDNFLELGGDSLIGLQVVYAVRAQFPRAGNGLSLYEHSTVAAMARFVADAGTVDLEADSASIEVDPSADPFELRSSRGERRRERRGALKRTNR
jgi:acyl transferase domain-containing protein